MLRKHLHVTKGLVNGSIGTLVVVVYDNPIFKFLKIKFDNQKGVEDIARINIIYDWVGWILLQDINLELDMLWKLSFFCDQVNSSALSLT